MLPATPIALLLAATASGAPESAADRAFLLSEAPGSIAKPGRLSTLGEVDAVCEAARPPLDDGEDVAAPPVRRVLQVRVPAKGFSLVAQDGLALDLGRGLFALRGGLGLFGLDREAGRFDLTEAEAKGLRARHEAGALALDVTFRLASSEDGIAPCSGHKRTDARRLVIEPLVFSLVSVDGGAPLARLRTEAHGALLAWLSPGPAELSVFAGPPGGERDEALTEAVRTSEAVQACLRPVLDSAHATGYVAFEAKKVATGRLEGLAARVHAFEDASVVGCLKKALAAVSGPRGTASVSIELSVARGE